ncbi:uncharacterized protein LOC119093111 isoform X2 [Pollicipes pollicipes]|uniref:uncharacterized protein LOC119093111 isoform X2 n=1 Tax=Pollicipes pollicipes TaxID=41117 RepID=UPI001884D6AE|nr:uncharacterized protein LOC119093111 isoform X2 [Pollicipes pollicipes]
MPAGRAVFWAAAAAVLSGVAAQKATECSPGPSVAATVFAVLLLLCLGVLGFVLYQYVWKPRHCPPLEKVVLAERGVDEGRFAFDNPYLEAEDDIGRKSTLPCHDVLAPCEKTDASRSGDSKAAKKGGFSVFSTASKQPRTRAADDSSLAPETITVPLRGHDFTGLGFNICGNMRDGIFIKDVSQHGPAMESGVVQQGDRVTGVTVSFGQMVLEDAVSILGYASPYDVQLHLQREPGRRRFTTSAPATTAARLRHPAFRSQSSEDLTKISGASLPLAKRPQPAKSGRPTAKGSSLQTESSTASRQSPTGEKSSKATPSESRTETTLHVQRSHPAAMRVGSTAAGFREMAIDVPERFEADSKGDMESASAPSKVHKIGIRVLPLPTDPPTQKRPGGAGAESPVGPAGAATPVSPTAGETRDSRRSVALGVPSLRLAARDHEGFNVDACLTKVANDMPCSRDMDGETGEPTTPRSLGDETDHRRVRMGTSSFKRQNRVDQTSLDRETGLPNETEKGSANEVVGDTQGLLKIAGDGDISLSSTEITEDGFAAEKLPTSLTEQRDQEFPHDHPSGEVEQDMELSQRETRSRKGSNSSSSSSDVEGRAGDLDNKTPAVGLDPGRNATSVDKTRQRSSSSSSSSASSGAQRPENMWQDMPDEMRLAAGAAQDRRGRQTGRQAPRIHAGLDAALAAGNENTAPGQMEEHALDASPRDASGGEAGPVDEEEVRKVVRPDVVELEKTTVSRPKIDKLEAFKEVLAMTPAQLVKRKRDDVEEDVIGETVEKSSAHRSSEPQVDKMPRITGEVTGIVEVGEKKSSKTNPVIVSAIETSPRSASPTQSHDMATEGGRRGSSPSGTSSGSPDSGRAVTRPPRPPPPPPPRHPASDGDGERLSSSTGDLSRQGRPESPPLGRAVSLELARPDSPEPSGQPRRLSAAACEGPQLDLSRVGRQDGEDGGHGRYGELVTAPGRVPRDSLRISPEPSSDEENAEETGQVSGTNGHGKAGSNHVPHPKAAAPVAPPIVLAVLPSVKSEQPRSVLNGSEAHAVDHAAHSSAETASRTAAEDHGPSRPEPRVPPTPAPRLAPAPRADLEVFQISEQELDDVMLSHRDYLRREAERRALVCRLAADEARRSSPAPDP